MDGAHDLGGRQGFGPVDAGEPEVPFHHDWEGRVWAIVRICRVAGWTIDWWRHVRELIDPVDYLTRPYFDSWTQTHLAALIDSGVLTLEEVETGIASGPAATGMPVLTPDAVHRFARTTARFARSIKAAPRFAAGDAVATRRMGAAGHCRLPGYAQGRPGRIHAHHGAHLFADAGARGEERAEHMYSVAFEAADLWPEASGRRDRVFLDLWESYLEPR